MISKEQISPLEEILQYPFTDPKVLTLALTHSSYANELRLTENNERLEFLGDAVISLIITNRLMIRYPQASEGVLSRWRSHLVSRRMFAMLSQQINLGQFLLLGKGEKQSGGEHKRSILACTFEAVFGAIYIDGGLSAVDKVVGLFFENLIETLDQENEELRNDQKTLLQEKTQALFKVIPSYRLADSWGPEHEKQFKVEISVQGKVIAVGEGKSKKEAEQKAATYALKHYAKEEVENVV